MTEIREHFEEKYSEDQPTFLDRITPPYVKVVKKKEEEPQKEVLEK